MDTYEAITSKRDTRQFTADRVDDHPGPSEPNPWATRRVPLDELVRWGRWSD